MNKELKESNKKWIGKMNTLSKDLKSFYKGMTIIGLLFCMFVGYVVYDSFQKPKIECMKTKYVLTRIMSTSIDPSIFRYMDSLGSEDTSLEWFIDTPIHYNAQMTDEFRNGQEHQYDDYLEEGVFDKILHQFSIFPYTAFYNKQMKFETVDYKELGMDNDYMIVEMKIKIGKQDTIIRLQTKERDKIEDIELIDPGNMEALVNL